MSMTIRRVAPWPRLRVAPSARLRVTAVLLPALLILVACAPPPPSAPGASSQQTTSTQPAPSRTIRMAVRYEIDHLAAKVIGPNNPVLTRRFFNASYALIDGTGSARPYLAESLPQLNTDSWRVAPDGRMETTYRLRAGLTWHDGAPLTAEDFAFGWRVYTAPGLGIFTPKPQDLVEGMSTPDARTVTIRWTSTFPDAGALIDEMLDPLPRHILEAPLAAYEQDPAARDALLNHPFWTTEYVGAGPYRLEQWEAGSRIEGVAFDGHALGRPKIDRITIRVFNDENTTLTNVLADNLDYSMDFTLRFEHAQVLKRDWESIGKGLVLVWPSTTVGSVVQFRPEYQHSPPLFDVRVRRALAHSIDRQAMNDGVFDGQGLVSETFVNPAMPYAGEAERAITKYPYDPRRTEALLTEAGLAKDREGLFASPSGERFRPDFWVTAGSQYERHQAIMVESWRRAGIDAQPFQLSVVAGRDNETRATFPGLTQIGITATEDNMENFITAQIGTAANRWRGSNRGGWSSAELDDLWGRFNVTLDRSERERQFIRMVSLVSDQLPNFSLYPNFGVRSHVASLKGVEIGIPKTLPHWNIHEWEYRS